jgi:hypothetical protein
VTLPFRRSYWADPDRLLAGCYPGDPDPDVAAAKLGGLLDCGIRAVVDLTEPLETDRHGRAFVSYREKLMALAEERRCRVGCHRLPIRDVSVPDGERMREIQAVLDDSLAQDRPVYVHCWGGRGRTGMVVGVYLVRRGLATVDDFVATIARLRAADPGGGGSPETREQIAFVARFLERERAGAPGAGTGA